tara:strand:+ start:24634 stop:24756 length:123 start_codon:yes stop_codon:yes gene_type:complete
MTKEVLPVGIQIHGKKWHAYKLLQLAKELDEFKVPKMMIP